MEEQAGEAAEGERSRLVSALGKVNSTRSDVQATYQMAGAAARLLERIEHAQASARSKGISLPLGMLGALQQCEIVPAEQKLEDEEEDTQAAKSAAGQWPQHTLPGRLALERLRRRAVRLCQEDWERLRDDYPDLATAMRTLAESAEAASTAEAEARAAAAAALTAQAGAASRWQNTASGNNGTESADGLNG